MRATVDAKTFSAAMDRAITVMKHGSYVPALETVVLRFGGGKCTMTATDLNTWLTLKVPAQGDEFTCAFYRAKEAAKTCHYYDGVLNIEAVDRSDGRNLQRQILLSCESRKATFEGFPPDEIFPVAPEVKDGESFAANAATLLNRINRIKYALMKPADKLKPIQTCVQFDQGRIFCMDGCRVACDPDPGLAIPLPFLAPAEPLKYLKLFGDDEVSINVGVTYIQFSGEGLSFLCHREGIVPFSLDQAIPKAYREEFYFSPGEFLKELDYLKSLVRSKRRPFLRFCGGKLSLESGPQDGCTAIHIEGQSAIELGFDVQYMIDALKQFEKEKRVKMKVSGPMTPFVLEAEGRNDYALVLPARLRQANAAA